MLFARIFQVALKPDTTVLATNHFRDTIGPALKTQPGYVTSRFLTNATTNRCLAVMWWDNQEHHHAAESSGALDEIFRSMAVFSAGEPTVDFYELAVQMF